MDKVFTIGTMLVFLVSVLCFLSNKNKFKLQEKLIEDRRIALILAFIYPLSLYIVIWISGGSSITRYSLLTFTLYIFLPTILVYLGSKEYLYDTLNILDFMAIMIIWIGIDARLVFDEWRSEIRYGFATISASWVVLCLFIGLRRITGVKYNLIWNKKDILITLSAFLLFAAIAIPLGYSIGFIKTFHPEFGLRSIPWFLGILFFTALPEELICRGIIQNDLQKVLRNNWTSLIIASLIFGAGHLNNGATGSHIWQWNWKYALLASIAGGFYGYVFQKTHNIAWPILFHASVDFIWHSLFN